MENMKDVYIVQCLMETDLYKLLKSQVFHLLIPSVVNDVFILHSPPKIQLYIYIIFKSLPIIFLSFLALECH